MKVSVEDVSSVKKIMHIEVPAEDVTRELDAAYKQLKKTAKIKGFRPGKAPRGVLERKFRKDVHTDVAGKLMQESFVEAIKETELNIIGSPTIDPPELDEKGPYKYDATVEIPPEIGDVDFKGLKLKKTKYEISDGEIEAQLAMLQKRLAERRPIEDHRELTDDDWALIDYEGFQNGAPLEALQKTENHSLKIGAGSMTADFDEQLKGLKPGQEKEFSITFPEDYHNVDLKGQTVAFKVALHQIMEEILPEINDDMAKKLGQFDDLEALKKAIVDNLTEGYTKRTEQELNEQIFQKLIDKTEFELPETLVSMELDHIVADAERSFTYHNMDMEQVGLTRDVLRERYQETAEKQVRRHLILSKIIEQEKLEVDDEEVEKGMQEIADAYQQPIDGVKAYYEANKDKLDMFKHTLLEKKGIQLIMENGEIEEVAPEEETETDEAAGQDQ